MAQARRTLNRNTPIKTQDHTSGLEVIISKIDSLASELKNVNRNVTERIDRLQMDLEKKLSDKLTDKMAQLLDKRINIDFKRLGKTVDDRIDTLRADINNDLDSLKGKINSLTDAIQAFQPEKEDKSSNVVFRKLPESVNEQLVDTLNGIIKDCLEIEDVVVSSARRIPNQNSKSSEPGLVIATFDNVGD
ncbi:hypothetical protein DPMN_131458 [Dreissena polymorpha]|uniref:Uncharacterized protein n=1 Tax=Dreissena polymorpha TaxID=45954 RepID=A0A9D4K205_DREPO|nr:hypothetical protein DPMN_131458 [Dreissena polymorpha]